MQHILPICILAYFFAKYLDQLFSVKNITPLVKKAIDKKEIQYVVNDKNIDHPHSIYYLQILGIYGQKRINEDTICNASKRKLGEIIKNDNKVEVIDSSDVKAARSYLLEQWAYCINLN